MTDLFRIFVTIVAVVYAVAFAFVEIKRRRAERRKEE